MTPCACIRLRLLGRLVLSRAGDPAPIRLSTRKAGALVAYLAMRPDQAASREELATLLWGNCSDSQARQSLRQALAFLRKDLGSPDFFTADTDMVRLAPGLWSVDALELESLSKSQDPGDLGQAAALFCGDFLAGLNIEEDGFDEWVRAQRGRTQLAAARLCEVFAARPHLVTDGERAVATAERLLALDPLREDWQRLALTLYARYRGTSEALAQYEAFSSLLRRELDVAPERDTEALIGRIRNDELTLPREIEPAPIVPATASAPPQDQPVAAPAARWSRPAAAAALAAVLAGALALGVVSDRHRVAPEPSAPAPSASASLSPDAWRPPAALPSDRTQGIVERAPGGWQSPPLPSRRADSADGPATAAASSRPGVIPIAVLPFATDGPDPLLADMIADDLGHTLARTAALRVISRQTSRTYPADADPVATGTELGVRYVLRGRVDAKAGLAVTVALVDMKSGAEVWSQRFQRDGGDRLAIQDEIVNGLGRELAVEVTRAESNASTGEVHALIFKGRSAILDAAASGLPALTQAEAFFLRALEQEPQNTAALTGLAAYHVLMAVQLFAPDPAPHLARAESILAPILSAQPASGEAYAYMGLLEFARRRSRDAARWFERAIEQSPSIAPAYAQLGRMLVVQGRAAEGLEHISYAMRLSPRDPSMAYWLGFAGSAQVELGDDATAIAYLNRAVALHPTQPRTLLVLVAAHAMAGDMSEARRTLTRLQKGLPHLTTDKLVERFFGASPSGTPRLREGLRRVLAADADVWRSPPMPSGRGSGAGKPARTITAIAVTPFRTFGEASASISEAMTDDLTNVLSRVAALRVISRQTMQHYAGKDYDPSKLSAELGVHYVLEGTIRPHGDKMRVNVGLIDPANRLTVWTARIERRNGEQHDIQDEIVMRIARELHFEALKADSARGNDNPGLFDLSRRGWKAIFEHGIEGLSALERAKAAFSEMLAREPDHWGARAGLGAYHTLVGSLRYGPDWLDHLDKGEGLLNQALREQPDDPGSHFYLSIVQRMRGQFAEAVASLERCIAIMPSAANCYAGLGHALLQQGRAAEGVAHITYAMRLSPHDVTRSHWQRFAGEAQVELGHFDEAVALLRQSRAANPRQPVTLRSLAAAYALSGNIVEAQRTLVELKAVAPHLAVVNRPPPFDAIQPELNRGLRMAVEPRT